MTLTFAGGVPDSFVSRLDPRWKLAALAPAIAAVACLRSAPMLAAALVLSLALLIGSRFSSRFLLGRLGAFALFLLPFLLIVAAVKWPDGWLPAANVAARALSLFALALVLASTDPLHRTLQAAQSLGVPRVLTQITLMSYRYVFLMRDEFVRIRTAMRVRGFRAGTNRHTYRTVGYIAGSMLLRGDERAQRVSQAMRCRGFDGRFHSLHDFRTRWTDAAFWLVSMSTATALLVGDWFLRA